MKIISNIHQFYSLPPCSLVSTRKNTKFITKSAKLLMRALTGSLPANRMYPPTYCPPSSESDILINCNNFINELHKNIYPLNYVLPINRDIRRRYLPQGQNIKFCVNVIVVLYILPFTLQCQCIHFTDNV